jgi:hypothetical protein
MVPILLIKRGGVNVGTSIKKYSKKVKKNNNNRSMNEQKKNDVQTTAAILRTK